MEDVIVMVDIPKTINMKLEDNLRQCIAVAIKSGFAKDGHDFVRKALANQLTELGIIQQQVERIFAHTQK